MNLNRYQKVRERIYTCITTNQSELNIQYVWLFIRGIFYTCNFPYLEFFICVTFYTCIIMQYHSQNFTYTYFFNRVWFDTRMKSSTYEFIHAWNVLWNFWNLRGMNSYRYEMFRETILSCNKSNVYEIVVFGQCRSLWHHSKWATLVACRIHKKTS